MWLLFFQVRHLLHQNPGSTRLPGSAASGMYGAGWTCESLEGPVPDRVTLLSGPHNHLLRNCVCACVCVCVCVSHSVMSDSYNPRDCSPLLSSVHRILQARILEWVAISFRRRSSQRDFPNPGIKPRSPALQVDYLPPEPPGKPFRNTATCYECCCFFSYWWLSTSFQFSKTSSTGLLHITYLQFLPESQLEKWRF